MIKFYRNANFTIMKSGRVTDFAKPRALYVGSGPHITQAKFRKNARSINYVIASVRLSKSASIFHVASNDKRDS